MAIFPFKCDKCGNVKDFFGTYKDSQDYEAGVACECGGRHVRQVAPVAAVWKTSCPTASAGHQNMAETAKKGGGK